MIEWDEAVFIMQNLLGALYSPILLKCFCRDRQLDRMTLMTNNASVVFQSNALLYGLLRSESMSSSSLENISQVAQGVGEGAAVEADRRESRLRLVAATAMLVGAFLLLFGAAWDGQWHAAVGRDRFLTPPHTLMYAGATAIGLLCIGMVILETLRYYRGAPGVNEQTTSRVLKIFHAPLGFIVTGFGILMILIQAPLDNYWHLLYGIDITVWSPFHIMGLLGGLIAFLGIIYTFGSEATRLRIRRLNASKGIAARHWYWPSFPDVLQVCGLAITLAMGLVTALDNVRFFTLGPLQFAVYPLVASFAAFVLVASVRCTGRIGAATATALVFTLIRTVLDVSMRPAVDILAVQEQLFYRTTAPDYVIFVQAYPAYLIVAGLLVDALYWLLPRLRIDGYVVLTITALLAGIAVSASIVLLETPGRGFFGMVFTPIQLTTLLLAMLVGAAWGWLGDRFALSIRLLDR
jgi:hypothetical protein